jgi:hypothetical protein
LDSLGQDSCGTEETILGVQLGTPEQVRAARQRLRYASLGLLVGMLLLMAIGVAVLYFSQGFSVHLVDEHHVRLC